MEARDQFPCLLNRPHQLREGRLTYGSFPFSARVKFLLVWTSRLRRRLNQHRPSMKVTRPVPVRLFPSRPLSILATSTAGSNDAREMAIPTPHPKARNYLFEAILVTIAATPTNLNVSLAANQDQVLAPRNAPTSPIPLEPAKTTNLTEKVTEPKDPSERNQDATHSHLPFERIAKPSTADVGESPEHRTGAATRSHPTRLVPRSRSMECRLAKRR